ncbi:MAG: hypothetical protein ACREOE_03525, partial [Gemmatimonadales bacterium]
MTELAEFKPSPDVAPPDVAGLAAGLGIALHTAGLPVGPDRCERLARAVTVMGATSVAELRACALATMVSDPGQMSTFDRVFAALFGGPSPFRNQAPPVMPAFQRASQDGAPPAAAQSQGVQGDLDGAASGLRVSDAGPATADADETLAEVTSALGVQQDVGRPPLEVLAEVLAGRR